MKKVRHSILIFYIIWNFIFFSVNIFIVKSIIILVLIIIISNIFKFVTKISMIKNYFVVCPIGRKILISIVAAGICTSPNATIFVVSSSTSAVLCTLLIDEMLTQIIEDGDLKAGDLKDGDLKAGDLKAGDLKDGDLKAGDLKDGDLKAGDLKADFESYRMKKN